MVDDCCRQFRWTHTRPVYFVNVYHIHKCRIHFIAGNQPTICDLDRTRRFPSKRLAFTFRHKHVKYTNKLQFRNLTELFDYPFFLLFKISLFCGFVCLWIKLNIAASFRGGPEYYIPLVLFQISGTQTFRGSKNIKTSVEGSFPYCLGENYAVPRTNKRKKRTLNKSWRMRLPFQQRI